MTKPIQTVEQPTLEQNEMEELIIDQFILQNSKQFLELCNNYGITFSSLQVNDDVDILSEYYHDTNQKFEFDFNGTMD